MRYVFSIVMLLSLSSQLFGQVVNLQGQLNDNAINVNNRSISAFEQEALAMDARDGDGLAVLSNIDFKSGTIELEIKGENAPGRSFVGFAFNIENDSTYEAVYFRPFNFVAEAPARRSHMMQYIFHPEFPWYTLREQRPDEFEAELPSPPDADSWFQVRIEISAERVDVYMEDVASAVLSVDRLTTTSSSQIGLWTGHRSSGWFRNLTVSAD